MSDSDLDTGDVVYYAPADEEWVVAVVEDGYLYWCGWPPGRVRVEECVLRKKAEPVEALALLRSLAEARPDDGNGYDARQSIAARRLQAIRNGASNV